MKYFLIFGVIFALALPASAHVTVTPREALIGSFTTFTIHVPSEKETATIGIRLVLPEGLQSVTPTVKPEWRIEVKNEGEKATEISWTGGTIPSHQRDEFSFSAQVPATETKFAWKAYQTYQDGSIVSWELAPDAQQPQNEDGSPDFSQFGPYSLTAIIDDLENQPSWWNKNQNSIAMALSVAALFLGIMALAQAKKR